MMNANMIEHFEMRFLLCRKDNSFLLEHRQNKRVIDCKRKIYSNVIAAHTL